MKRKTLVIITVFLVLLGAVAVYALTQRQISSTFIHTSTGLSASTNSLSFGNLVQGTNDTSSSRSFQLTNTGGNPSTVTYTITGVPANTTLVLTVGSSSLNGQILTPNQTVTVTATLTLNVGGQTPFGTFTQNIFITGTP